MSVYCYRCGQRLAGGSRHCPGCGASIFYDEQGLREDFVRRGTGSAGPDRDPAQAYSENKTYEDPFGEKYEPEGTGWESTAYDGTSGRGASYGGAAYNGSSDGGTSYSGTSYGGSAYGASGQGTGYGSSGYRPYGDAQRPYTAQASSKRDNVALWSMLCGIIGLFLGFVPFFGIALSAAAIVMGILGLKSEQRKGLAIAGLVMGIISFVLNLALMIAVIYYMANPELLEELLQKFEASGFQLR